MRPRRIVLFGAELPHLIVMEGARALQRAGVELTLVSGEAFWYDQGLAPEVLSGAYSLQDFRVDIAALAARVGVNVVLDEVTGILWQQKKALTKDGRMLAFDLASFSLGGPAWELERDVPVEGSFTAFPARNVLEIRNELETLLELFPDKPLQAVVVGAGVVGVEYALHAAALLSERRPPAGWTITLLDVKDRVLPDESVRVSRVATRYLRLNDVQCRLGTRVQHVQSGRLVLDQGETLEADLTILAWGRGVPRLFLQAGMPTDALGAVQVTRTLNVPGYPELFAAGRCARAEGIPEQPSRGTLIHLGRILHANLLARVHGRRLRTITPATGSAGRWVSLGPDRALWTKGGWVLEGRRLLAVKRWRDRRWMRRWQFGPIQT